MASLNTVLPTGGQLGVPADFLVASNGRVVAAKYGQHAYDQWSIDELLTLAGEHLPATSQENGGA